MTRVVAGTLADAALAGACYQLGLNLATTSLLFLLAVVAQALGGGAGSSVIASIVAAAFLDYFFVPPVLTWRISDPLNVFALLAFITTSLIVTNLASKARQGARVAEGQRRNLEQLYQASQGLIGIAVGADVTGTLLRTFRQTFGLQAASFFDGEAAEIYFAGESRHLAQRTRDAFMLGLDRDDPTTGISTRCLRQAGRVVGALGFEGLRDPEVTAGPLVALTIATLERARAAQAASRAAAETKAEVFRAAVLDGLAHEFKTPLAIITAAAGGIRETGPLNTEQRELVEAIEDEAARLGELTTRFLRKAEVDREEINPRLEKSDLGVLAPHVVERYTNQFPERAIRLERNCGHAEAMIDKELVGLALSQLLDNALKYSPSGSPIVVRVSSSASRLEARVWNGGSSIAPAERSRIFDRFHRGADGQQVASGSGLGLYVARKIARAHGGTLEVDAEDDDEGVTFCLSLPSLEREPQHA